jgi:transcriptional regulator EpsA
MKSSFGFAVPDLSEQTKATDFTALEALAFNLEASLRVFKQHHFFSWTQGLLQNLIRHELLICALRKGEAELSEVDSFSPIHADPKHVGQLYRDDAALSETLIKEWEAHGFQPVIHDVANDPHFTDGALQRELNRIEATKIIAHGTHDTRGKMVSFFVFASRANATTRQARHVEMLLPFIHSAWISTKLRLAVDLPDGSAQQANGNLLTLRELEVLKWVYLGKSNIEIGCILGISSLTVKNHVEEILRRLDVQNRTQAVGKAFKLHILTC